MSSSQSMLSPNPAAATPTARQQKKFSWDRPKLSRSGTSGGSKLTFSASSKPSGRSSSQSHRDREYSSHSDSSRPPSPPPPTPSQKANEPWVTDPDDPRRWQKISRENEVSGQAPLVKPKQEDKPFLVYNDGFLPIIGSRPSLTCLIQDTRGPYFQNSGIFSTKSNTLFVTSAPVSDSSPSMAPSRNLSTTLTKIDFYSPADFSRDKVRTGDHVYMPRSGCAYKDGIVICAQGTYKEPAALIFMGTSRPHRHVPLLTNFNGVPLNSPHSCVAHADGSLWFSDPHLNNNPSFRPKPRLPPMIYRFDPSSSDLRAVCSDIAHPTSLAFSPDYKTLYIMDGTPPASSQPSPVPLANTTPMIWAYSLSAFGASKAPFLTHKRLFAFTTSAPTALVVDRSGNVYIGCLDGVHVFDIGGTLVGRIVIEGGASGLCFGKTGELWVSGGDRLWKVKLQVNAEKGRA